MSINYDKHKTQKQSDLSELIRMMEEDGKFRGKLAGERTFLALEEPHLL